jgi:peptide/nickel transport system substrate-binding protein
MNRSLRDSRRAQRRITISILVAAFVLAGPVCSAEDSTSDEEKPQYGGTLNIATVYPTLSALSWDSADWNWKHNHDTGMIYEQLFAADLDKSVHKGGRYLFRAEAYLPEDAMRGELAESWEWEDPLTLVIHLRRGAMFTDKPGVMKARELTADDVVFSFERVDESPKKIASYFDHIDSVEARDAHTVVINFNRYNAEWAYRFGYGYYSAIVPRELGAVDAKDWRNVVGTGPFELQRHVAGSTNTYVKNPAYWDTETLGGEKYPIPFVDKIIYRTIKDEATYLTALRTGKLDILEYVRWLAVDHLKKTTPELKWSRWLSTNGTFLVMRNDREPFDDIRVRRALNIAINNQEIVDIFYGGHAEIFAYPMHTGFVGYYQPLEEMPPEARELFTYDPQKAKRMLAEAGYPDGFEFTVQVATNNSNTMDLLPLIAGYLDDIGVEMTIQPLEYAAFLSAMTTRNHTAGYMMASGHTNPTTSLRKNFQTGQLWNPSMWSDPDFDRKLEALFLERDEDERKAMVRSMVAQVVAEAPYIWLPIQYNYSAWWPWVKNYDGELRAGAVRPGPIYARIWIDHELKKELGF